MILTDCDRFYEKAYAAAACCVPSGSEDASGKAETDRVEKEIMELKNEKKLGFGCMRLPLQIPEDPVSFDYPLIEELFDRFLARGFTYFDTAYTYHGYHGEEAVRRALVERHPRNRFQLATKLPLRDFRDEEDLEKIFEEQLTSCGVDYFDFYLLHNMGHNVYAKCEQYHAFDFVRRKQQEGKIRVVGMSFHDTPELLDEILTKYGDRLDFVQLQVNYIDWEQPNVQSRRCLDVAWQHQKPVTVMEPCKGGTLVKIPARAEQLLKDFAPDRSVASWAMRFAASQKGVFRVLSGMNTREQVEDNADALDPFQPLTAEEMEVIRQVRQIISSNTAIACTACEYCTHGCPKNIAIPAYFALYNSVRRRTGSFSSQHVYYNNTVLAGHGRASDCIGCGKCEQACPQHLTIRAYLADVADVFDHGTGFPTRKQA